MPSRGSTVGGKKRKSKQRLKAAYSRAREDAQLAGVIPTVTEGAVRDERVAPSSQDEQPLPGLIGQAIRRGWAVPEERKPRLVDELMEIVEDPNVETVPKVMAYNALTKGDQLQYERDNPEDAGKAKGGGTEVNVSLFGGGLAEIMTRVEAQRGCTRIEAAIGGTSDEAADNDRRLASAEGDPVAARDVLQPPSGSD